MQNYKIFKRNVREKSELGSGFFFFNTMLKVWFIKEKNKNLDFIKTKVLCFAVDIVKKMGR